MTPTTKIAITQHFKTCIGGDTSKLENCIVWYGMVWYGMVWYGMVWYGMVWYGIVR